MPLVAPEVFAPPTIPLPTAPFAVRFPETTTPVPVTTTILALPATLVVTLPLTPTISTLLVPFAILDTLISPAFNVPVTERFVRVRVFDVLSNMKLAD